MLSTIQELFQEGVSLLRGFPQPHLEAKMLLLKSISLSEEQFFTSGEREVSSARRKRYLKLLSRRLSGFPLPYLTGTREFWSIPFRVAPGVFIPRPETELLVEKALEHSSEEKKTIVDIGTGCGNIAVSLARELPRSRIVATDTDLNALKLARLNAVAWSVKNIIFARGSLFSPLTRLRLRGKCDVIVSNPPYVSLKEWETIGREIQNFEPPNALLAGETGLEIIQQLIRSAPVYLKPGGLLLIEIGYGQKEKVQSVFDSDPVWKEVNFFEDLSGIDRVVSGKR